MGKATYRICEHEDCDKQASFNEKGLKKRRFCGEHRESGMIQLIKLPCEEPGCDKPASCNINGAKGCRFCFEHRLPGMETMNLRYCEFSDCRRVPTFALPDSTTPQFCSIHKLDDMIPCDRRLCEYPSCDVYAGFNFRGLTKRRFCNRHKLPLMVSTNPVCEHVGCERLPSYNVEGAKNARFCAIHHLPGMKNVLSKRCEHVDCDRHASFKFEGERAKYCGEHRTEGMTTGRRTCEDQDCGKRPSFNAPGTNIGRLCGDHRLQGMEYVCGRKCEHYGCCRQPAYNTNGVKPPRFCGEHRTSDMQRTEKLFCTSLNCDKTASFGFSGKRPEFCASHRKKNTIFQPRKRCLEAGCKELAVYGIRVHEHCASHRLEGELNISETPCRSCGLLGLVDKNGNCETCDPETFKRVRLAKQNMVRDYLVREGFQFKTVDRMIDGGACGRERPDFMLDCGTHILIIEVDEEQHSGRACECEQTRMVNISQSNGMPTIFLRWNPDRYKTSKKGIPMAATSKRLAVLKEWALHLMKNAPVEFLSVMYLYFDGYQYGEEKLETILANEMSS